MSPGRAKWNPLACLALAIMAPLILLIPFVVAVYIACEVAWGLVEDLANRIESRKR